MSRRSYYDHDNSDYRSGNLEYNRRHKGYDDEYVDFGHWQRTSKLQKDYDDDFVDFSHWQIPKSEKDYYDDKYEDSGYKQRIPKSEKDDEYDDEYKDSYYKQRIPKSEKDDDYKDTYNKQMIPKTENDAQSVMERAKDWLFWFCDDTDNKECLAAALNLIYNKIPGNKYSVQYQNNMSGTRLVIVCETCDKTLGSYDPFLSHEIGKKHKKVRQQKSTSPVPNIKDQLKVRKINKPRNYFLRNTLENDIDQTRQTTIGVHFIYKEIIGKVVSFTCTLCKSHSNCTQISRCKMLKHITGENHMKRYLEVKHGFDNRNHEVSLEEEAKNIEELEGKIHKEITDFTNQLKIDKCSKRKVKTKQYASSSSSDSDSSKFSPETTYRRLKRSPSSPQHSLIPDKRLKRLPRSQPNSPSPSLSCRSRQAKSLSPIRMPPPSVLQLTQNQMEAASNVQPFELCGKTIQDLCTYLEADETKDECINTIAEDFDMQNLIIHALHVLSTKVETYYKENALVCNVENNVYPLEEESLKMNNYICQLSALSKDPPEDYIME